MKIICPECAFARDVPDEKIPPKTKIATCPKCGHRFSFRDRSQDDKSLDLDVPSGHNLETDPAKAASIDAGPTKASQDDDIWDSLSAMNPRSQVDPLPDPEMYENHQDTSNAGQQTTGQVPWEHLDTYGFFPGLLTTIKQVMLHPVIFFRDTAFTPDMSKALIFYLLIAEIQALAQFFWPMTGMIPLVDDPDATTLGLGIMGVGSTFILVLYPLFLTLMLFVMVSVNHLCLRVFKAADQGFAGTFKAVTYGSAPMILALIPLIGPLIGAIWSMITTFFGYKYIHKTTTTQVILAMSLPMIVMILLALLFVVG